MEHAEYGVTDETEWPEVEVTRLRLADGPLQLAWSHCGETSDFVGGLFAARCSGGIDANEARHSIGYLVNELLENSIKFRSPGDVIIEARLKENAFEMKLANFVASETALTFQNVLAEITAADPSELLIRRIEENAAAETASGSGLGLLTLMSDYGARLGWRFSRSGQAESILLQTHAALPL